MEIKTNLHDRNNPKILLLNPRNCDKIDSSNSHIHFPGLVQELQ